jgi:FkbM family methyltransferase
VIRVMTELRRAAVVAALRVLARFTPWAEPELLGLRQIIRPGDICIDIGAALGLYTVTLSRLVGPRGTVHSIEPLVFAHPTMSLLLRPREGPNIVRHSVALGIEQGRDVMSVPVRHGSPVTGRSFLTSGSSGLGSNKEFTDHLEVFVKTDTLDHFVQANGIDRVDFIKADVEGAELRVLEGARETIDRFKPAVLVEIEERHVERFGYGAQDVVDYLSDRGYQMSTWRRNRWLPTMTIQNPTRNYLFRV